MGKLTLAEKLAMATYPRRCGNTWAAVHGAKEAEAVVITATAREAQEVTREHGVMARSIHEVERMRGCDDPIIADNHLLQQIGSEAEQMARDITDLRYQVNGLERGSMRLRGELDETRADLRLAEDIALFVNWNAWCLAWAAIGWAAVAKKDRGAVVTYYGDKPPVWVK